jgi:anti-sigma regulatory factor (Ser/Thr protein kinase)
MDGEMEPRSGPGGDELSLTVGSSGELSPMRSRLRRWLGSRIARARADEVVLATGEAVANALEHGEPPVTMMLCWEDDRELGITITDNGTWAGSDSGAERGFGLPIMSMLMDTVRVDTTAGTSVTLRCRFPDD